MALSYRDAINKCKLYLLKIEEYAKGNQKWNNWKAMANDRDVV